MVEKSSIASRMDAFYPLIRHANILLFVGFLAYLTVGSDFLFVQPANIQALIRLIPEFAIVVLGIGLLMIAGEYDLSISSTIPTCAYVFTVLLFARVNVLLIIGAVAIVGLLIGFINGIITTKAHIPSFITTLGTLLLLRGMVYTISGMAAIGIGDALRNEPTLVNVFTGSLFGVPSQFLWFVALAIVFGVLLHFHKFGYWVYATGDNKEAARAMGINTDRVKITCFMIVGLLAALSAIVQVIRIAEFHVVLGTNYELQAIASCAVGGVSLFGGIGGIAGIFVGALMIPIIQDGIIFLGIPVTGTTAFVGLAILIFVLIDIYVEKRFVAFTRLFYRRVPTKK